MEDFFFDGFGIQFMFIIFLISFCEFHNHEFIHRPIKKIDHNYNNNQDYIDKIEDLINLKNKYRTIDQLNDQETKKLSIVTRGHLIKLFLNDDISKYINNNIKFKYKDIFRINKNANIFSNNKFNVSIHIRRTNQVDKEDFDRTLVSNEYYINKINQIKEIYKDKDLHFNIFSQGFNANFDCFHQNDITLYIDYDISLSFQMMVLADILVTAPSGFSYAAALLSNGIIYHYNKLNYKPLNHWIICND
jgi:hypothetical protein